LARRSSSEHPSISTIERCTVIVLGLYLSAVGMHALAAGRLLYPNYLRSPVFAPIAVAIGIVLIAAGVAMRN
jgi:hypothetical protein